MLKIKEYRKSIIGQITHHTYWNGDIIHVGDVVRVISDSGTIFTSMVIKGYSYDFPYVMGIATCCENITNGQASGWNVELLKKYYKLKAGESYYHDNFKIYNVSNKTKKYK